MSFLCGKENQMNYRHEWKYELDHGSLLAVRQRLSAVAKRDPHAIGGTYRIRSLYFDNANDKVLREKIDGVNRREKFRFRYYNENPSFIRLEKKSKINGLCRKESVVLKQEQIQALLDGDDTWMLSGGDELVKELYVKVKRQMLRPKVIVDYVREPFVYAPGHVRVTLDSNIRTGMSWEAFLNPNAVTLPAGETIAVLEVKWDEFLPDIIRDAVQTGGCLAGSFSKYAACRIYG